MFTRIYALAVCYATILCIAISSGIGLYDVLQISFPKLTMDSYLFQNLQSNNAYRQSHLYAGRMPYPLLINQGGAGLARAAPISDSSTDEDAISEEEITRRRNQQLATTIENFRHDAQRSLLQIMVILLVSIPLFIIHWRFARKLDTQNSG